jgi:MurNAc alpha-1-phosphate uridylyltransferase
VRAILFAAGRGERMRPLTDRVPKPLLEAGGKPLIEWQVERLVAAGIREIVVNIAPGGEAIEARLGDGSRLGAAIAWSREPEPLETAGGIAFARALLGEAPFLAVSSDIHADYDYGRLRDVAAAIAADPARHAAHFVLVPNPPWHREGDMGLRDGRVYRDAPRLTYGNISLFHPTLFDAVAPGTHRRLFPFCDPFMAEGRVTGERHDGEWDNVGTPAQLADLDRRLRR